MHGATVRVQGVRAQEVIASMTRLPRIGASLRKKKRRDKRRPEWQCFMCGSTTKPEPTGERWRGEFSEEIYRCRTCGHRNLLHDFRPDEFEECVRE